MNSKIVARYGMIFALVIVAYYIDALISMGLTVRTAIVTMIVVMTVIQLFDFWTALFTAAVFGCSSFVFSFIHPNFTSGAFMYPYVSILPRLCIAIVSFPLFKFLTKAFGNSENSFKRDILPRAIGGASGALTNTLLVVPLISVALGKQLIGEVVKINVIISAVIEFSCALAVVPIISLILSKRIKQMKI